MRATTLLCGTVVAFLAGGVLAGERLTQTDLLWRLIDLDRLTRPPPSGEQTGLFSSYDRSSRIGPGGRLVDWHADNDCGQFIRREPDGWYVMAEMEGPGAITRLWCAQAEGQFRVVLDGEVVIDAPLADLFREKLPPFTAALAYQTAAAGGYDCYFPIGFAKSCRVLTRAEDLCYQVEYVRFAPGTEVETFKPELSGDARAALEKITQAFMTGLPDARILGAGRTMTVAAQQELAQGDKLSETIDGAGTIRALYVSLTDRRPPRAPYALRHCVLRLYWDGQQRPSVEAPLVDFFGSGFDRRAYNSLVMGTANWTGMPGPKKEGVSSMYCYFPMPFARGARIELENFNREKIGLMFYLRVSRDEPPKDSLRFKARYRREDPCDGLDYAVMETSGRGRFVGCTLAVACPRSDWWGAGDQKVWVDGPFPTYFGTGTADYFGSITGLPATSGPLVGVTRSAFFGQYSAYRWQIADCLNFQKLIHFAFGNLQPSGRNDTYYSTVAYWYGEHDAPDFFEPLTPEDLPPPGLRIPHAVEVEGNVRGQGWVLMKQKYAGGVELSGAAAVRITTSDPVQINIPSAQRCKVRLKLRVHPRRSFQTIEVRAADGSPIGSIAYRRSLMGVYTVGQTVLEPGDNLVTVICTGKPVLDCWIAEPLPE